jgi:uncharacterized protein YhbP (UPF0306 family)
MQLRGHVATGQGQGYRFTSLAWAREQFIEQLGIDPHPGTLNLRLTDAVMRQNWRELRHGPAALIRAAEPGACDARCFHVDLGGSRAAAIVWPQVDAYPDDQVELIAVCDLRQEFHLADGAEVTIEVLPRPQALRRSVQAYLAAHNVLSLATQGSEGPWAASVFYVQSEWTLYFLSAPDSRHSSNLTSNPRVAATINPDYTDWREIQGVQLEGTAAPVSDPDELSRALTAYQRKYPFVYGQQQAAGELERALRRVRVYRLVPGRVWFVDNSQGLGHRDEVEITRG